MAQIYTGKAVHHCEFGTGRVVNVDDSRVTVNFIKSGVKFFRNDEAEAVLLDPPFRHDDDDDDVDTDSLKEAIREVLREEGLVGTIELAEKWDGGEMVMKPGKPGLQEKSVPIETFFHKVVMLRNQLRVLEQNINSNTKLTDSEKVDLQQYITRCYGSLTTFNVLFADKRDWFVGAKKE
ncbi:MAG: hypothetical protein HZC51_02670 [Nitrospirae bacterium]|nr:hypothetical protein [Nitrospirota bacterium]